MAGDLNGRLGPKVDNTVVGPIGEEITNESGERIIDMCETYKLKITNTYFCHKNIHLYTWERPSLNKKSIIDYKSLNKNMADMYMMQGQKGDQIVDHISI